MGDSAVGGGRWMNVTWGVRRATSEADANGSFGRGIGRVAYPLVNSLFMVVKDECGQDGKRVMSVLGPGPKFRILCRKNLSRTYTQLQPSTSTLLLIIHYGQSC